MRCSLEAHGKITIPDSVTRINDGAFIGCENMTYVEIPDSVITIGVAPFIGCSSLTHIKIPERFGSELARIFVGTPKYLTVLLF